MNKKKWIIVTCSFLAVLIIFLLIRQILSKPKESPNTTDIINNGSITHLIKEYRGEELDFDTLKISKVWLYGNTKRPDEAWTKNIIALLPEAELDIIKVENITLEPTMAPGLTYNYIMFNDKYGDYILHFSKEVTGETSIYDRSSKKVFMSFRNDTTKTELTGTANDQLNRIIDEVYTLFGH